MNKNSKIYIAWHTWLVWWAIVKKLNELWYNNLILKTRKELDLLDQKAVYDFYEKEKPEYVINSAAKVWWANDNLNHPTEFLLENIQIQNNIIQWASLYNVNKLIFIASSTVYPTNCEQPIKESALLTWKLDELHEAYWLAKITWIKLCEKISKQYWKDFKVIIPTNIYWEWDHFEENKAHVIWSLINRFHNAVKNNLEKVEVWWTGNALREFLYVDDIADACIYFLDKKINNYYINIWTENELSIKDLAYIIKDITNFNWQIVFDTTKPEWRLRRKLDITLAKSYWWENKISFQEWLKKTYKYYLLNH